MINTSKGVYMNISELKDELIKRNINMTDSEIAGVWGMDAASFSRKKKAGTEIKYKNIEQIENKLNISFTSETIINNIPTITLDYFPDIEVSCGNGILPFAATKEKMTIPVSLIKGYSKNNKYAIVSATSDSMQPEIKPNDMLIIRVTDSDTIIDNHIYVFCYNERLYCKYLSYNVNQIIVRSANKDYPTRFIEKENINDFRLCGEVCGHFRSYK